jgi:hypothetical protein
MKTATIASMLAAAALIGARGVYLNSGKVRCHDPACRNTYLQGRHAVPVLW